MNDLGSSIRNARTRLGMTQEALAAKLKIAAQTVSKWERGESLPDSALLPDLADALRLSLDRLFGRRSTAWPDAEAALLAWLFDKDEKGKMDGIQTLMGFCFRLLMGRYAPDGTLEPDPYGEDDPHYPETEWDYIMLADEGMAYWKKSDILPLGLFIGEGGGWLPLFEDPDLLAPLWESLADPCVRRAILGSLSGKNIPFDISEAPGIFGTDDPGPVISRLKKACLLSSQRANIDGEETQILSFNCDIHMLALLLVAQSCYGRFFGSVPNIVGLGGASEHRYETPPLRKK